MSTDTRGVKKHIGECKNKLKKSSVWGQGGAKKDVRWQPGHQQTNWKPFKKTQKIGIEKDVEDLTSH